jgi:general secretion pathway protein B
MSYILEALKKSEHERGNGNIPDVQTVHSSSLNYRNDKKIYWPYFLIVAILLNLSAILYFILDKEKNPEHSVITPQNEAIKNTVPVKYKDSSEQDTPADKNITIATPADTTDSKNPPQNNTDKKITKDKSITRTEMTAPAAITMNPEPVQAQDKDDQIDKTANNSSGIDTSKIQSFYDLPESITRQLPAIIISAHVYSTNPLLRSIVINNNFMEEGEYVLDDLILYEITADGAIFNYQGILFSYGAVSSWR